MRCLSVLLISILLLVKSFGFISIYKSKNDLYQDIGISNEDDNNENHLDYSVNGSSELVWQPVFINMMKRTRFNEAPC